MSGYFISVSPESIAILRRIAENDYNEGFLRLITSNSVLRQDLNRAAKSYTNGAQQGVDLGRSAFDELVETLDLINSFDLDTVDGGRKFLHNLGFYNGIKGIYGELKAIKKVKSEYSTLDPKLRQINDKVEINGLDKDGLDSVWDLKDGRTLYVESKNYKAGGGVSLGVLKTQFTKHINTKIIKEHIEEGIDGGLQWVGGKVPILHYQVRGTYFTDDSVANIFDEFKTLINNGDDPFDKLKAVMEDTGTTNDKILKFTRDPETIPPLSI